jgi:hypothetical protein
LLIYFLASFSRENSNSPQTSFGSCGNLYTFDVHTVCVKTLLTVS